jgi:large subunit ribosomal protein L18
MKKLTNKTKRHLVIRKKIKGSDLRPRLSVFRSNKDIYVQLIDDNKSITLIGLSSKIITKGKTKTEKSYNLGLEFGKLAKDKGYTQIVFDRGGNKYHGRVKAFAEGARESGLIF